MTGDVELVTVDASNLDELGFFCYKSKRKSEGYQNKLRWVRERIGEGMVIKIVYQGGRSVGFIEYIPAEHAWRAVEAPDCLVIHCLWVVGRAKGKGYGSWLLDECVKDARRMGKAGVVMVSSRGNWLANEKLFVKNGFESVRTAPPSFDLLLKKFGDGAAPAFPQDWEERQAAYGSGMTVIYADQCPYIPDAVRHAREAFEERGISSRAVRFTSSDELRAKSPSAYGIFGIVHNGKLFSYHYIGTREMRRLDEMLSTD